MKLKVHPVYKRTCEDHSITNAEHFTFLNDKSSPMDPYFPGGQMTTYEMQPLVPTSVELLLSLLKSFNSTHEFYPKFCSHMSMFNLSLQSIQFLFEVTLNLPFENIEEFVFVNLILFQHHLFSSLVVC